MLIAKHENHQLTKEKKTRVQYMSFLYCKMKAAIFGGGKILMVTNNSSLYIILFI